ncbi:MAG: hypothetical protein QNJ70_20795 [Xenococcaceae cyanobacterium MO_207.B15]|nr:hypothetical protein [Xenococcaceae cyanobacterium MO_207.B15]
MKINLTNKSIKNAALASVTLLALSSTPLFAQNTFSESTSESNFVKKGDTTLMLRDDSGFPVWHGWRRNQLNQ